MAKRDIFGELMEGMAAMRDHRGGKVTLRSYKVDVARSWALATDKRVSR